MPPLRSTGRLALVLRCLSSLGAHGGRSPLDLLDSLAPQPDASLRDGDGIRVAPPAALSPSPFKGSVANHTVKGPGAQPTALLYFHASDSKAAVAVVIGAQSQPVDPKDGSIPPIPVAQESTVLLKVVVSASAPGVCPDRKNPRCQRIYYVNITRGYDPTSDASLAEIALDREKSYGKARLIPSPFVNSPSISKYVAQEEKNASSISILLRANQTKASIQVGRFGRCADVGKDKDPHQCTANVMVGSREKSITVVVTSPSGKVTRSYEVLVGEGGAGATAPDDDYWQRFWGCPMLGGSGPLSKVKPCGLFWLAVTGGSIFVRACMLLPHSPPQT